MFLFFFSTQTKFYQILASVIINIIALGTGASYGIANVLVAELETAKNATISTTDVIAIKNGSDPFHFTIDSDQASWFGKNSKYE